MKPAAGERRKLYEGAVDGIGTDQGKFWIKDADGKKLVDQSPASCPAALSPSSWWRTF